MEKTTIIGPGLPNIPWQDRPAGETSVLWRYNQNPVIQRNPIPNAARIYNSAVIPYQDGYVGIFRADYRNGRPHLHFGTSQDGINWRINEDKIFWQDESGQPKQPSYAYDPRLVQIEDVYYVTWCDDFPGASIGLGYTRDFKTFIRLPNAFLPFNRNGVLFPGQVHGKYLMLTRPSDSGHTPFGDIYLSESPDMIHWGNHKLVIKRSAQGWWQTTKIGTGPAPLKTSAGWLLFYHGVTCTCNGFVYSMGAALLDLNDPAKVLYRASDYLLTPEADYETTGFVPNVVFPCAALADSATGRLAVYYGAADTYTAIAFGEVEEIIDFIKEKNEDA